MVLIGLDRCFQGQHPLLDRIVFFFDVPALGKLARQRDQKLHRRHDVRRTAAGLHDDRAVCDLAQRRVIAAKVVQRGGCPRRNRDHRIRLERLCFPRVLQHAGGVISLDPEHERPRPARVGARKQLESPQPLLLTEVSLFAGIQRPHQPLDATAVTEHDLARQTVIVDLTASGVGRAEDHERAAHRFSLGRSDAERREHRRGGEPNAYPRYGIGMTTQL